MLKGKKILLGISGGIACYKAAELTSLMIKNRCTPTVLMTENAEKFISPLTFEALTGKKVYRDTFDKAYEGEIPHIELTDNADCLVIAPATANIIGKIAGGIADDMLTSSVLAADCKKIICPAMNTRMYENIAVQENIKKLKAYGWRVIEPDCGRLACGTTGRGKLPSPEKILEEIIFETYDKKDLKGRKILVTAGATREALDPVRYITNHSTGKMGYALAERAALRGAEVTLITGKTQLKKPSHIKTVEIESAEDMFRAVTDISGNQDIIVKAAAVADFTPAEFQDNKIKKDGRGETLLKLKGTRDILAYLGEHKKEGQFLCGFSMETENLIDNSRKKLIKKNLDMIAANNLRDEGAGFGTATNLITLITKEEVIPLELMSKEEAADRIFDEILKISG